MYSLAMINQITPITRLCFLDYFTWKYHNPVIYVQELTLTASGDRLNNVHVMCIANDVHYIRQIQVLIGLALIKQCTIFIN